MKKDTFLFEVEYDKEGNPDIRVTLQTARIAKMTIKINDVKEPNFEDLPINMQLEKLYTLGVNAVKYFSARAEEEITSLKNADNRRKFPLDVMNDYASIVKEVEQNKKSLQYWEDAREECLNYSKKNHRFEIYDQLLNTPTKKFRKIMKYFMNPQEFKPA